MISILNDDTVMDRGISTGCEMLENLKKNVTNHVSNLTGRISELHKETNKLETMKEKAVKKLKAIEDSLQIIKGTDNGKNSA